jgi:hypothetical protein|tara:strand:+ start:104 stop:1093 length:990 start_codon:yes stop_codon:yes gene_type:complete
MLEDKVEIPGEENEQETEIDLEAPAPEQSLEEEINVETVEDNSQSADASQESSEQPVVQDSKQKDELGEYSEGVQKRIAKLTRKMREAERQKEEAIQYAQTLKQQADRVKGQYDKLGTNYAKELEQKVTAGMAAAKAELRSATEAQDVDRQVEAQKAIAQMAMEETRLTQLKNYQDQQLQRASQTQEQIVQQPMNAVPTTQELYQAAQEIDPKAQDWSAKNTWFGTDNAMTYTAFDIHRQLVEDEGYDPQSNEYYSEVDKRIRLEFPHKFANVEQTAVEQPAQTVASAKRPAKKGRRKTVKLTPSQIAIAKRLGVPLEEYAKQLIAKEA